MLRLFEEKWRRGLNFRVHLYILFFKSLKFLGAQPKITLTPPFKSSLSISLKVIGLKGTVCKNQTILK